MLEKQLPNQWRPSIPFGAEVASSAYLALCAYSIALSNQCDKRALNCIHHYWLDHWLIDYEDGFTRRGFLGGLHAITLGHTVNIIALNLLCIGTIAGILLLARKALKTWIQSPRLEQATFAIICASPIFSVFIETLGDPLHLILLLFGLFCAARHLLSARTMLAAAVLLTAVGALIHEASLLLIAPSLWLLVFAHFRSTRQNYMVDSKKTRAMKTPQTSMLFAMAATTVLAMALLKQFHGDTSQTLTAVNPISGFAHSYSGLQKATFTNLLLGQFNHHFSGPKQILMLSVKPFLSGLVPISTALAIRSMIPTNNTKRKKTFIASYALACTASLPLFVIAHDWGRFAIYNLIIGIFTATSLVNGWNTTADQNVATPSQTSAESSKTSPARGSWTAICILAAIILLSYPISKHYRIDGIPLENGLALLVAGFVFVCAMTMVRLRARLLQHSH